ncbi:hypothetical protein FQN49_000996 [Arthroderma sp. PD_2]|nr:hypothetical protein FQN49_000996 [Arthroderma sp. PD_2]
MDLATSSTIRTTAGSFIRLRFLFDIPMDRFAILEPTTSSGSSPTSPPTPTSTTLTPSNSDTGPENAAEMAFRNNRPSVNYPDFRFCGQFSGEERGGAELWLTKLDWELRPIMDTTVDPPAIPPANYLFAIKVLLTGQAKRWIGEARIRSLMGEGTQAALQTLKVLLCARFPGSGESTRPLPFDEELATLKQKEGESLTRYYERGQAIISLFGIKNPLFQVPDSPTLSRSERVILDMILKTWAQGLSDTKARGKTVKATVGQSSSLGQLMLVAL